MNVNPDVSKEQLTFLKKVKRKGEYIYSSSERNMVVYLCQNNLLTQYVKSSGLGYCSVTELGKAYLYSRHLENRFRSLPIAISLFAAIGGYREEISAIARVVMKLLKSLTGN